MSPKSPVIKFSPFEALLIGEKNNIIKRKPMKDTLFVKRINHKRRSLTLRDLFDVENDNSQSCKEDGIFKVPQRVREYLKSKQLKVYSNGKKQDVVFVDFNKQKMVMKNNGALKSKSKNSKLKANKIKFKNMYNLKANKTEARVARKFQSCRIRSKYNHSKYRKVLSSLVNDDFKKQKSLNNRHLLRDKSGRFISRKEYNKMQSKGNGVKKCFANYLHQFYVKKSKLFCTKSKVEEKKILHNCENNSLSQLGVPYDHTVDVKSDNLEDNSCEYLDTFAFPYYPKFLEASDFDDDENLTDLIYENFPCIKFESHDIDQDFDDYLWDTEILPPEKRLKMYEKKKSGLISAEKLATIFNKHIPYLKVRQLENTQSYPQPFKNGRNGFPAIIDEPCTKKNHLVTTKNFECVFLRSLEGKEIFLSNLVKPLWQNSWFGRLPES